jgi:hypothetical protein
MEPLTDSSTLRVDGMQLAFYGGEETSDCLEHGDKLFLKGNRLMSGYIFLANVS